MRTNKYFSPLTFGRLSILTVCGLTALGLSSKPPQAHHASGGGTYDVMPGVRSEFQFNEAHVQCKVAHAVMEDGTVMQMFMFSTGVDSVSIDSVTKTATLTGSMVSIVRLRFTDGTTALLSEMVPFVLTAKDNATRGVGADSFSLTVVYEDTPGLDQFDLFGSPAIFAGPVLTGNVTVK